MCFPLTFAVRFVRKSLLRLSCGQKICGFWHASRNGSSASSCFYLSSYGMKAFQEYGSWKSNIDVDSISSGNCRTIKELQASEEGVFWLEQEFSGRCTVYQYRDGRIIEWTSAGFSVGNSVHEYGGGSFIAAADHIYFVTENGIYLQCKAQAVPKRIVEASKLNRFADLCYSNGSIYAVNEIHSSDQPDMVENRLVRISDDGATSVVACGADFYACPRVSLDNLHIAWMEWSMPHMPWDETTVKVARINSNAVVGETIMTLSEKNVNFHGLQWGSDSDLYVISDKTGWWNVYVLKIFNNGESKNLYPVQKEIGSPAWNFGDRQFAVNGKDLLLNVSGKLVYLPNGASSKTLHLDFFSQFSHLCLLRGSIAFCIASGPSRSASVLKIELERDEICTIRGSRDEADIANFDISLPKALSFSSDGISVSGWFYPPYSKSLEGPRDTLPPVVLMAHGGPTSSASNSLSMKIQFFTSRGFAVFDVNYRGSTGYGTEFRNMLRGKWGIVDRNDIVNAADYLVKEGLVDPKKICIMGSSAGGFLVLRALLHSNIFAAAACLYGVTDLVGLYKDTHKFERGYNEQLIGKYPEESSIYEERSPINKAAELNCPICFFHGTEDAVVPLSQSKTFYEATKAKGLPTALVVFPGEGHGFRGVNAVKESTNGVYYFFCRVLGIKPSLESEISIDNLPLMKV